jgi:hypothetical protein
MTMYQPGDRVWLRTTAGEMFARLIEVEGGPRMLAREDQFRPADDADLSLVVEG